MKVCRIDLKQSSANYARPETVDNRMTYPLPPISTIMGAIHTACGYKEYHDMSISIQGTYGSMVRKPYTDHAFLNTTQDDRGYLVLMNNKSLLSKGFDKVAYAKSQKASFYKGIDIDVYNEDLLMKYRDIKDLRKATDEFVKKRINPLQAKIKKYKQELKQRYTELEKKSMEYERLKQREKKLTGREKMIKDRLNKFRQEKITQPYEQFATLTKSLKYYEILHEVELTIHIKTDEDTINDIIENIYNLTCLGRSEDMVEIVFAGVVDVTDEITDEIYSKNSAYIDAKLVKNEAVLLRERESRQANGTGYYLNTKYDIINNQRIFEKKKVIYASKYWVDDESTGVYIDHSGIDNLIVSFV